MSFISLITFQSDGANFNFILNGIAIYVYDNFLLNISTSWLHACKYILYLLLLLLLFLFVIIIIVFISPLYEAEIPLILSCLETQKRVIGKQCRPRSDVTKMWHPIRVYGVANRIFN